MADLWYALVALLFTGFAVLDGFDFGAGMLHLWVARTNLDRRTVLQAIGPLWDGNEVWLLAAGGSLFLAFPAVLAIAFSGFYLALFIFLWLLLLRGIAIEFRSHLEDAMWRGFWDVVFCGASLLLAFVLGVALGNVLRGVPLSESGPFRLPLFASWSPLGELGLFDWYTLSVGAFVTVALSRHGALFLALRAGGPVAERAHAYALRLRIPVLAMWLGIMSLTLVLSPHLAVGLRMRPLAWVLFALTLATYALSLQAKPRAFYFSLAHLATLLALAATCHYPFFLKSPVLQTGLDVVHTQSPDASLKIALTWWLLGFPLALSYFFFLWRYHREPVIADDERRGY